MLRRDPPVVVRLEPELGWGASIHDDSQFEVTLDYTVVPAGGGVPDKPEHHPRFHVDLFLVAPPSVALDAESYPRDRFFADLTQRMRLHTPDLPAFADARIPSLDRFLALGLDLAARERLVPRVTQDLKLFANYVNLRLKEIFVGDQPRPGIKYKRDLGATVELVERFQERYAEPLRLPRMVIAEEVRAAVVSVDDYLADRLERALSRVALAGTPKARKALERRHAGRTDLDLDDPASLERYYHRYGRLKKLVSEVLYLHPREVRRDQFYKNLAAAGGAALAAAFAETARYYNTGAMANGTADFGLRVAFFLGIAVVAYVFKDRLKDFAKEYFGRRVSKRLADRETQLLFRYADREAREQELVVAQHQEWVRYTRSTSLPDDVRYVWQRFAHDRHQRRPADVLHYAKVVRVEPGALDRLEFTDLSVKEILRFDTSAFLRHFDNPLKELAVYDSEEGCVVLEAPKVYYLDLMVRIACRPSEAEDESEVRVEAIRAVLDKQGIVRLDRPVPEGRYAWRRAS